MKIIFEKAFVQSFCVYHELCVNNHRCIRFAVVILLLRASFSLSPRGSPPSVAMRPWRCMPLVYSRTTVARVCTNRHVDRSISGDEHQRRRLPFGNASYAITGGAVSGAVWEVRLGELECNLAHISFACAFLAFASACCSAFWWVRQE